MEKLTTKERILIESLDLFSKKGFDAVSVEEIAQAVGIKAPSLYKHYKSKQEIFDGIFVKMKAEYEEKTISLNMHFDNDTDDSLKYQKLDVEKLITEVKSLIDYSLENEFVSKFRRLMTIEQYRSKEISKMYTERYVNRMLSYHEKIFSHLINKGLMKNGNPKSMAWQYVSPIITILGICDREPEKKQEMMDEISEHIKQFTNVYQIEE